MTKIKYPLGKNQKQALRDRFEEIINKTSGTQVIILLDENKITDYYQNACLKKILKDIEESGTDYSHQTDGELLTIHD